VNEHHPGQENEQAGAYVLDALPADEVVAFEAHLMTCPECRAEVSDLQDVVGVLPLALEPVEPPASLRDRISRAIEEDVEQRPALTALPGGAPKRSHHRRFALPETLLGLAAVAVIAALGIWNIHLQNRIDQQQAAINLQQLVSKALSHRDAVYPVAPTSSAAGASAYMVQPQGRQSAYLIVKDLPTPPSHKVYQLWLLRGGVPTSAGTFTYSGSDPRIVRLPMPSTGYTVTAVTVENAPHGSAHGPTGAKVLVGTLGA
jgi:anti-sigma-K factor RskA